jgi:hypothetical protein
MIAAPIYTVCKADAACQALLGDSDGELRLYPFNLAPKDAALPYVTWQNVNGTPTNFIGDNPDSDAFSLQVNVWGVTTGEVIAVTQAIRDAIQEVCYIVRWGNQDRDAQSLAFGYDFDVDWLTYR